MPMCRVELYWCVGAILAGRPLCRLQCQRDLNPGLLGVSALWKENIVVATGMLCTYVQLQNPLMRMLTMLQQQGTALKQLQSELHDDNALMESRLNELPAKLDSVTKSLVDVFSDAANSQCILVDTVILWPTM